MKIANKKWKWMAFVLAGTMCVSMVGCGNNDKSSTAASYAKAAEALKERQKELDKNLEEKNQELEKAKQEYEYLESAIDILQGH